MLFVIFSLGRHSRYTELWMKIASRVTGPRALLMQVFMLAVYAGRLVTGALELKLPLDGSWKCRSLVRNCEVRSPLSSSASMCSISKLQAHGITPCIRSESRVLILFIC